MNNINLVTREQTLQIASNVECLVYLSLKSPSTTFFYSQN